MAYKSYSRRSVKRLARKSRRNFIVTLLIIGFLIYATFQWVLPSLITGLGFIKGIVKPSQKNTVNITENASFAPPVLNIPFEATHTGQINVRGYATPNSKVALFLDDDKKDTVDVPEDGSFEFKNIQLVLGTNNIYGKSIDEKNQESLPSKTFKVIYDNEKPSLDISEPEDGKKIQGGDKKVKFVGTTEPNAQVFINDSQIIVNKEGKFESEQVLNDGDNDFNIKAVDAAANTTEVSRRVTYQP